MIAWTKFKFAAGLAVALVLAAGTATIVAQKTPRAESAPANAAQRSAPIDALRYLAAAFTVFDGDRVADSFVTNSPTARRTVLAMAGAVSAEGRLRKVMEIKFGRSLTANLQPAFRMNFGQDRLDQAVAQINADVALVTIPGRGIKEPMRMTRTSGVWRIDDQPGREDENSVRTMQVAARVADELADAVKQGRIKQASEVGPALQKRLMELMKE